MESTNGTIVVGVTGTNRETAAMLFAAECARRVGAEVVLAHAFHQALPPPPPSTLMTYAEAEDVARIIVKSSTNPYPSAIFLAMLRFPAHAIDISFERAFIRTRTHAFGRPSFSLIGGGSIRL